VKENDGSGGIDGVTIESFEGKRSENIKSLLQRLKDKDYRPTPVDKDYVGNGTLKRSKKKSFYWYQNVIKNNGLVEKKFPDS